MNGKLVAGLTTGFLVFWVVEAANAASVFFDDFEDMDLAGWAQSNSGGSGTFDVVEKNGSNRAHVGHVSNTSSGDGSSLSITFDYTASDIVSFEMEALAFLGQYGGRIRHGLAGVEVSFLNVFNVPLGSAGLFNVTSTSLLGPNDYSISNTQQSHSASMQQFADLAGLGHSDPIAKMSLSFVAEGSYSWGGNVQPNVRSGGNVWFDNVIVSDTENGVFASTPGGYVNTAASADGAVVAATLNADGSIVVFIDEDGHSGWSAQVLEEAALGPMPTGMPVTFIDPRGGLIYVAYPSNSGLMLYRRGPDGTWTLTNLTSILPGASPIVDKLTWLISPPAGGAYGIPQPEADLISLVGVNPSNEVVRYAQQKTTSGTGWSYSNLSARDLAPTGQSTPTWDDAPIGYTTPWNGQNVAGLNAAGQVLVAWTGHPSQPWAVTNLADFTPTPPLAGGLSAYVNWGINLTGVLDDGSLGVTWWSAEYEQAQRERGSDQNWAFTNLTAVAEGLRPRLSGEAVVGLTTPNWVSNNIYGIAQDSGHLVAYWWGPGEPWRSVDLNAQLAGSEVPTGKLTGVAAKDSSISVFGVNDQGEVLRFFWQPDRWRFENVSQRVAP
jgi:hypothetical protein